MNPTQRKLSRFLAYLGGRYAGYQLLGDWEELADSLADYINGSPDLAVEDYEDMLEYVSSYEWQGIA